MIAAIILFAIGGTTLIWSIVVSSVTNNDTWFLTLIITFICSVIGIGILCKTPTNVDVREGKAYYIEQNHIGIVNGDTINNYKTYQIEWIENFK